MVRPLQAKADPQNLTGISARNVGDKETSVQMPLEFPPWSVQRQPEGARALSHLSSRRDISTAPAIPREGNFSHLDFARSSTSALEYCAAYLTNTPARLTSSRSFLAALTFQPHCQT